jgi:NADH-quinone oxidoreductase subunit A
MNFEYVPVFAMLVLSALVPGLFLAVSALFAPRCPSVVKGEPFECGNVSSGPAWGRFSVKFYLTAILFIVFDVEVSSSTPGRCSFAASPCSASWR